LTSTPSDAPRNVTAVGGLVVRDDALLVVKLAYGGTRGSFSLPGGRVDPGETLDMAVRREVREETSIEAHPLGIVGIRSRFDGLNNDTYILWRLDHIEGTPTPDDREIEVCNYVPLADLERREDVTDLVRHLVTRLRRDELRLHEYVPHSTEFSSRDPNAWKLFL